MKRKSKSLALLLSFLLLFSTVSSLSFTTSGEATQGAVSGIHSGYQFNVTNPAEDVSQFYYAPTEWFVYSDVTIDNGAYKLSCNTIKNSYDNVQINATAPYLLPSSFDGISFKLKSTQPFDLLTGIAKDGSQKKLLPQVQYTIMDSDGITTSKTTGTAGQISIPSNFEGTILIPKSALPGTTDFANLNELFLQVFDATVPALAGVTAPFSFIVDNIGTYNSYLSVSKTTVLNTAEDVSQFYYAPTEWFVYSDVTIENGAYKLSCNTIKNSYDNVQINATAPYLLPSSFDGISFKLKSTQPFDLLTGIAKDGSQKKLLPQVQYTIMDSDGITISKTTGTAGQISIPSNFEGTILIPKSALPATTDFDNLNELFLQVFDATVPALVGVTAPFSFIVDDIGVYSDMLIAKTVTNPAEDVSQFYYAPTEWFVYSDVTIENGAYKLSCNTIKNSYDNVQINATAPYLLPSSFEGISFKLKSTQPFDLLTGLAKDGSQTKLLPQAQYTILSNDGTTTLKTTGSAGQISIPSNFEGTILIPKSALPGTTDFANLNELFLQVFDATVPALAGVTAPFSFIVDDIGTYGLANQKKEPVIYNTDYKWKIMNDGTSAALTGASSTAATIAASADMSDYDDGSSALVTATAADMTATIPMTMNTQNWDATGFTFWISSSDAIANLKVKLAMDGTDAIYTASKAGTFTLWTDAGVKTVVTKALNDGLAIPAGFTGRVFLPVTLFSQSSGTNAVILQDKAKSVTFEANLAIDAKVYFDNLGFYIPVNAGYSDRPDIEPEDPSYEGGFNTTTDNEGMFVTQPFTTIRETAGDGHMATIFAKETMRAILEPSTKSPDGKAMHYIPKPGEVSTFIFNNETIPDSSYSNADGQAIWIKLPAGNSTIETCFVTRFKENNTYTFYSLNWSTGEDYKSVYAIGVDRKAVEIPTLGGRVLLPEGFEGYVYIPKDSLAYSWNDKEADAPADVVAPFPTISTDYSKLAGAGIFFYPSSVNLTVGRNFYVDDFGVVPDKDAFFAAHAPNGIVPYAPPVTPEPEILEPEEFNPEYVVPEVSDENIGSTAIILEWPAYIDALLAKPSYKVQVFEMIMVDGVKTYKFFKETGLTTKTSMLIDGLMPETEYKFYVFACYANGDLYDIYAPVSATMKVEGTANPIYDSAEPTQGAEGPNTMDNGFTYFGLALLLSLAILTITLKKKKAAKQ